MEREGQKTRENKQRQLITLFRKKGDEVNNWFGKRKTSPTIDDQASNSHCLTCNPTITSINGERHVDINHKSSAPLCCCCICMSEPKAHKAAEINGCEHVFCFECIDEWSKHENTCPLCKVPFTKIVPKEKSRLLFYRRRTKIVSPKKQSARAGIFVIEDIPPVTIPPVTIRNTEISASSRHERLEPSEPHSISMESVENSSDIREEEFRRRRLELLNRYPVQVDTVHDRLKTIVAAHHNSALSIPSTIPINHPAPKDKDDEEIALAKAMSMSMQIYTLEGSATRERHETENPDENRTTFPHHTVTPCPCHPTGVASFSPKTNTKTEGPHVRDMLLYLNKVKLRFQCDQPHVYDEFFHMMQYEEMENIIERVAVLFRGHNDLILNFNALFPDGYRITTTNDDFIHNNNSADESKMDPPNVNSHKFGHILTSMTLDSTRPYSYEQAGRS